MRAPRASVDSRRQLFVLYLSAGRPSRSSSFATPTSYQLLLVRALSGYSMTAADLRLRLVNCLRDTDSMSICVFSLPMRAGATSRASAAASAARRMYEPTGRPRRPLIPPPKLVEFLQNKPWLKPKPPAITHATHTSSQKAYGSTSGSQNQPHFN
eukprot:5717682-Pleurochrysis_carterae.AAC.1